MKLGYSSRRYLKDLLRHHQVDSLERKRLPRGRYWGQQYLVAAAARPSISRPEPQSIEFRFTERGRSGNSGGG